MTEHCGCCGRETIGEWCLRCRQHILKAPLPPWDRTYFAQFKRFCPFRMRDKEKLAEGRPSTP